MPPQSRLYGGTVLKIIADIKRCLAEANLVKGDLLEILALWPEHANDNKLKAKLALSCLQLLVPLTWPPELELRDENMTVNNHRHLPYLQLAQVDYKRGIMHYEHAKILRTAVRIGLPSMAQSRRERSRRDEGIIKLVLYLFRNIAMITQPQHLPSQGDENEISRSSTIQVFKDQDVFNLLLTIGSGANDEFQEQDVILLEILFCLLEGVDAKKLFMESKQVRTKEAEELRFLVQKEKAMLGGYNKHAPTRHNRFGTMIWVKRDDMKMSTVSGQTSITNESSTLQQMDLSKKWDKPRYRRKMVLEFSEQSDFGMRADLTESAREHLRAFVEDFLDSSFNPLFSSLRKAIERETDRVQEMHRRQYFYLTHWFLNAECARRDQARRRSSWHADRAMQVNPEDNTFAYIAAVLDQETFVLLNRQMQKAFDEKNWQDLQATLLCFTQVLLTVQSMTESQDEEDQEIADNIQQRIFYEETTHDRIVQILRGYTNQGFAYLDAVTECVHVFVRMLERYSKQNADLQIRSKRRARKKQNQKQKQSGDAEGRLNADEEADLAAEDEREAHAAVSERKFDFARFSAKFLSQPCVDTFVSLLRFHADLTPVQLKRCHRFFYRLAFKHDLAILLFRVDILQLLHRLIKGPSGLPQKTEGFKDWEVLVQQIFRRCIKWLSKEVEGQGWKEMCVVEMLFSKIPNSVFYLRSGYERVVEKRPPRRAAELEFKAAVGEDGAQKLAVAVGLMIDQSKSDALGWVKKELERSAEERQAWVDERATRSFEERQTKDGGDPQAGVVLLAPTMFLSHDTEERKMALFKDKHLRLLLTTLGFERLGLAEDADASWVVPSELGVEQLKDLLEKIKKLEFDPPTFDNGKTAKDLVRSKSSAKLNATFSDSEGEGEGSGGDIDANLFPPNLREKRKDGAARPAKRRRLTRRNQTELTEAEIEERAAERKRKDKERNSKIKSQLYVTASDDESDEERDAEFFRLEEERRKKNAGNMRSKLREEADGEEGGKTTGRKRKSKGGKERSKKRTKPGESEEENGMSAGLAALLDDEDEAAGLPPSSSPASAAQADDSTDEDAPGSYLDEDMGEVAEEETPSTSPTEPNPPFPLTEKSSNIGGVTKATSIAKATESDDDEDDVRLVKPALARRNVRAGFIVDDSDSD